MFKLFYFHNSGCITNIQIVYSNYKVLVNIHLKQVINKESTINHDHRNTVHKTRIGQFIFHRSSIFPKNFVSCCTSTNNLSVQVLSKKNAEPKFQQKFAVLKKAL